MRNEEYEMGMRHVPFDMNELAKLAAQSVGAVKCVHVEKLGEGLYNKPFLFTMEDGSQVVGKVPNLSAGLPHFTTASEVATMDFVRCLTYISNSCTNPLFTPRLEISLALRYRKSLRGAPRQMRAPSVRSSSSWR